MGCCTCWCSHPNSLVDRFTRNQFYSYVCSRFQIDLGSILIPGSIGSRIGIIPRSNPRSYIQLSKFPINFLKRVKNLTEKRCFQVFSGCFQSKRGVGEIWMIPDSYDSILAVEVLGLRSSLEAKQAVIQKYSVHHQSNH